MRVRHHPVYLALLAVLVTPAAFANCGSSACAVNTNWDEHSASQPGLNLDLRQSYIKADQLRSGSSKINADTTFAGEVENLRTITRITTLTADYTMTRNVGITLQLPYISRDHMHNLGPYDANGNSAGVESFNANSLGDIKLTARVRSTASEDTHASIGAKLGFKLPTGRKDFTLNTGVVPGEVALQPGNGSTDLIAGIFWNQATPGAAQSWFVQASLQTAVKHDAAYRPGDQLNLDIGTRYNFGSGINGLLQINSQWNGSDTLADGSSLGGLQITSLTPGLSYAVTHEHQYLRLAAIADRASGHRRTTDRQQFRHRWCESPFLKNAAYPYVRGELGRPLNSSNRIACPRNLFIPAQGESDEIDGIRPETHPWKDNDPRGRTR